MYRVYRVPFQCQFWERKEPSKLFATPLPVQNTLWLASVGFLGLNGWTSGFRGLGVEGFRV